VQVDEPGLESATEISTLRDRKQRATDIGSVVLHSPSLFVGEGGQELDKPKADHTQRRLGRAVGSKVSKICNPA